MGINWREFSADRDDRLGRLVRVNEKNSGCKGDCHLDPSPPKVYVFPFVFCFRAIGGDATDLSNNIAERNATLVSCGVVFWRSVPRTALRITRETNFVMLIWSCLPLGGAVPANTYNLRDTPGEMMEGGWRVWQRASYWPTPKQMTHIQVQAGVAGARHGVWLAWPVSCAGHGQGSGCGIHPEPACPRTGRGRG